MLATLRRQGGFAFVELRDSGVDPASFGRNRGEDEHLEQLLAGIAADEPIAVDMSQLRRLSRWERRDLWYVTREVINHRHAEKLLVCGVKDQKWRECLVNEYRSYIEFFATAEELCKSAA